MQDLGFEIFLVWNRETKPCLLFLNAERQDACLSLATLWREEGLGHLLCMP